MSTGHTNSCIIPCDFLRSFIKLPLPHVCYERTPSCFWKNIGYVYLKQPKHARQGLSQSSDYDFANSSSSSFFPIFFIVWHSLCTRFVHTDLFAIWLTSNIQGLNVALSAMYSYKAVDLKRRSCGWLVEFSFVLHMTYLPERNTFSKPV